jgi:Holliday junction resolvasome RuvABC endonuclease subunit
MRVLGLDISSTTIGWGILDITDQITLFDCGFIKPTHDGDILSRICHTKKQITEILEKYQPTHIAIEDIIQYMSKGTSANTIIILCSFNRCLAIAAAEYLTNKHKTPTYPKLCSVHDIRTGLKTGDDKPEKEEIPDVIAGKLGIPFPYEYGRKQSIKKESYDIADGIAVGLYYSLLLIGEINEPDRSVSNSRTKSRRQRRASKESIPVKSSKPSSRRKQKS